MATLFFRDPQSCPVSLFRVAVNFRKLFGREETLGQRLIRLFS